MFNNVALDVFIGLVFIFLLYSLLATIIQEMIATRLAFRAKVLEKAILRMLEDGKTTTRMPYGDRMIGMFHLFGLKNLLKGKKIAPWFYAHPLIKYLSEDNYYSKPAYLDAKNFAKVMLDLLKGFGQPESQAIQSIHNSIAAGIIHKLPINLSTTETDRVNPAIKVLLTQNPNQPDPATIALETVAINTNTALFLRTLWQDSGADINIFRQKLEQWFDDTMLRATDWYKRYTRIVLFATGLVVAYVFNVDTIAIHRILSKDKVAREQLVNMAIQNKNKYADEIGRIRQGDSARSDSLLKNTYDMVANDAQLANSILGLGRPWKDSCKICDSIYGCKETKLTFYKKFDSLKMEAFFIDSLSKVLVNIRKEFAQKDTVLKKTKPADLKKTVLLYNSKDSTIKGIDSLLKLHDPESFKKYKEMIFLSGRCNDIREQSKTWFKYSPNQTGGLETVLGWLLTAFAITLGAPFWFDLLSKLIGLRGGGTIKSNTDTGTGNNKPNTPAAPGNPVSVIVNSNPGEEAVG